ncbi:hypothetical protein [Sporolactobacillus nakayamae]|uniref:Uncharacterized protein n=1 Tax=Sporolactobacillus nakayamae TaxID=269670 RepID=A0A1I2V562_9BACL|nr:hypothetical protein [Sporolactobacillus nakayamae]SFG82436.1 hypothetical protein SAMN02982927_02901 [Sporolactobacillus nakayamae]
MLSDFERKLRQIMTNDRIAGRKLDLDLLAQRTGHGKQEIVNTIEKLNGIPYSQGGLGR